MVNMNKLVNDQRHYFEKQHTYAIQYRINQLRSLKQAIKQNERDILDALNKDLNKSDYEAYLTEVGIIYDEINLFIKKLPKWAKNKRVKTPITHLPGKSYIVNDPYGVTLIIAPWNYPFQLSISPLIGAIAGGNTAVIKPSEHASHTEKIIKKIIEDTFDTHYIAVVTGGVEETQALLNEHFDYIFFTGSVPVGQIVMEKASRYLTPVTLELGGKSPAIVTETANVSIAAKRIAFGKCVNAGQTCVAPDYVLIHESLKEPFIDAFKQIVHEFYGDDIIHNPTYPKIINEKHFKRLINYIKDKDFILGGNYLQDAQKIEPTLVEEVSHDSPLMTDEIFGPILPIITYRHLSEALKIIKSKAKPLALYLFTEDKETERLITNKISYGGGCINDTILHVGHRYLPFGGVGSSGIGAYHGEATFKTFTHQKSIFKKSKRFDFALRYPPFIESKLNFIKKLMK